MSDEQREQGRDADAPADGSRTDQHPVPSAPEGNPDAAAPTPTPAEGIASGTATSQTPSSQTPATQTPASPVPASPVPAGAPAGQGYAAPGQAYGAGHGQPYAGQPYGQQPYAGRPYGGQQPGQAHGDRPTSSYAASSWAPPRAEGEAERSTTDTSQFPSVGDKPGETPSGSGWPYGQHAAQQGGTAVAEKPRRSRTMTGIVAAALIAGVVGGGLGFGGAYALLDRGSGTTLTQSPASSASNAANIVPGSVAAAAAKAMPSTVDIQVALAQGTAEGSGVILTADGDVLTNNHVVAGATGAITVTLADGSEHQATVLGTSPSYDLAVIKLQGVSGLTPAVLGESSSVQVGQQVVAIGSPQGLTGTVTTGIVSAFNRTVSVQSENGGPGVVYNGLQTDAPINQGNSGGPLVNLDGQVIGINSAIATGSSQSTGSIGLGFAIPVDQAKRVAQEIIKTGSATKPVLGVTGRSGGQTAQGGGATITTVQPGSPAAGAGLAAGDVVTKVGDAKVENFSDLVARIGSYAPGQQVTLTVTSGGASKTVQVTLGSQTDKAASTGTGGENANPFGGGSGNGGGSNPFGNLNPFGGGGN
ncbi:trypsin-like peptidase domain-containing protein [Pseudonocardia sp.]|uniref:trypsin-like peptidase domain-containing protein n=1 Tax=Pseudonocardia sp. TaxID=60912 RepID=UPI0025E1AD5C|nr:trypsin-like peptidase domain-containing protein [Pseudonocardia sp.]